MAAFAGGIPVSEAGLELRIFALDGAVIGDELLERLVHGAPPAERPHPKELLRTAETLREAGDLEGASDALLECSDTCQTRLLDAMELDTGCLWTLARASAALVDVSARRGDWATCRAAACDAMASSETLLGVFPACDFEIARVVARAIAVATVSAGETEKGEQFLRLARRVFEEAAERGEPWMASPVEAAARAARPREHAARARVAGGQAARAQAAAATPRALPKEAVVPAAGFMSLEDAAAFSAAGRGTAVAFDVAARRELQGAHGGFEPRRGDDGDCSICLEKLADGDDVTTVLRCGHAFHANCLDAWLRRKFSCPLCKSRARRRSRVSDALLASPRRPLVREALRDVRGGRGATWTLARDAHATTHCARVATGLSTQAVAAGPVLVAGPGLRRRALAAFGAAGRVLEDLDFECGRVVDTTAFAAPLRCSLVGSAPVQPGDRRSWVVEVVEPCPGRSYLAVGLGLDGTRRLESFAVVGRRDGACRRGRVLRQTAWLFRVGERPTLCCERGPASFSSSGAFKFAESREERSARPLAAGDQVRVFVDSSPGAELLRVQHLPRGVDAFSEAALAFPVLEVLLRASDPNFGYDGSGLLRPVVECRNGQQKVAGDDAARAAARPFGGWLLRVAPTSSVPPRSSTAAPALPFHDDDSSWTT
ncbi:ubiquitin-protein transferase [Aureococcus anophagefferens]|nr:ubiquitin-protein transferase [Aureococcus anophagefferens]